MSIDAFAGRQNFQGLGQLTAADLAGLFESRRAITPEQLALAARAWSAFRSPDPRDIQTCLATDTTALPYLAAALARHLEEFPSDTNGLSRSERQIMDQAIDAPVEIRDAFPRTQHGETAYFITDTSFFDLANALASASPPLLTIHLSHPKGSAMPVGTIALTKQGLEVVHGRADRLQVSGIDRWLGGVHLTGHGPAWRWSARDRQLIEA